ncbi:MAG: hypothetical protein H8E91_03020 [Planctomycetes bacterium]|nr:hypothetical protein [Planctomycetota bacterium]
MRKTLFLCIKCNTYNAATRAGGAIANYNKCTPLIEFCRFKGNQAGTGGAISNWLGVQPQVTQCEFLSPSDTTVTR